MASEAELEALRRLINIPDDEEPYTDAYLAGLIDSKGSVEAAASAVWLELAASFAGYVDTTESGSSRKLSQMSGQALAMATGLNTVANTSGAAARSGTSAIERV